MSTGLRVAAAAKATPASLRAAPAARRRTVPASASVPAPGGPVLRLQRRCACGAGAARSAGPPTGASADCEDCRRKAGAALQRKLVLGAADDAFEAEADRIADRVVGRGAPLAADAPPTPVTALAVQRRAAGEASPSDRVPPIVGEVLAASGAPLDGRTRSFMESRFGHDFGHVRVHVDAKAADSARSVAAQAYTVGSHIVFGDGRYAPGTADGRRLLAHELTHVVQQTGTLARKPAPSGDGGGAPAAAPPSPGRRLATLAAVLESYANRADARVAASGEGAAAIARVRVHLGELRGGIERLRQLAAGGDAAACAAALSGFTPERLRLASRSLVPAGGGAVGADRIAVAESAPLALAARSLQGADARSSAVEIEAERVADAVVRDGGGPVATTLHAAAPRLQRYLDTQALQQAEQNLPALAAAAGVTLEGATVAAGAIAAGGGPPGWVIGLAIVAVVAVVAVGGYLYYRSQSPESEAQPQPLPLPRADTAAPDTRDVDRKRRRNECFEHHPGAVACDEPVWDGDEMRDERIAEFLFEAGYSFADFTCAQFGAPAGAGVIDDCGGAPAIGYHCRVKGTPNVVSIFACLCCDIEGNSRLQWSRPHWSINQSRRGS